MSVEKRNQIIRTMLKADAYLCLIAGLAMGALALAGPLAIWLGLADFRLGFGFLQVVNAWASWIAGVGIVLAVGIAITSKVLPVEGGMRLTAMALVGVIVSLIAYVVPETFRPPEGTPPIHDITTNLDNPPQFIAIAPIRADAPNSMEYGSGDQMTPDKLRSLQSEAYPDIVPQRFDENEDVVFENVLSAVDVLGWEVISADKSEGRIEATDTTFWFRFKDDVIILLTQEDAQTVLNARSLSRVGISDVGKNAARLRELFELLKS